MRQEQSRRFVGMALVGDVIVVALVTGFGFASHGTLGTAGSRILATFFPTLIAWLLIGPHLGVFDPSRLTRFQDLWRPFWAMVLAGPFAAWLRGAWLGQPILPIFVVILGGVSALSLLAWRWVLWLFWFRKRNSHG